MVTARGDSATNLPMRWLSSAGGRSLVSTHAWNWNHYTSILLFMFVNRMSRAHFQGVCSQGFSRLCSLSFACFIIMDVMGSSRRCRGSAQHNAQNQMWDWRSALLFCQRNDFPQTLVLTQWTELLNLQKIHQPQDINLNITLYVLHTFILIWGGQSSQDCGIF